MNLPRLLIALSVLLGGLSSVAFGGFLWVGSFEFVSLDLSTASALSLDAALCAAFFIQHSGMIRKRFRDGFAVLVPSPYHAALYSIASGTMLWVMLLAWQTSSVELFAIGAPLRWVFRGLFLVAVVGSGWAVLALGSFDPLGIRPIRARLRGQDFRPLPLSIRGPYRWVRHPLYSYVLVLIWTCPDVSADRLLFNVLWTIWIVGGTILEERDLVAEFGEEYRTYQRRVPMLVPWRLRSSV